MHFMKTGCNGKISQVSGFQNHLQTKSNLHILSIRTDSKNPVCHGGPCSTYLVFTLKIDHLQWFSNLTAKLCCQLIMCEIDNKKSYND